jgi:glycosyltransferase involved in cell wall biosynthesis
MKLIKKFLKFISTLKNVLSDGFLRNDLCKVFIEKEDVAYVIDTIKPYAKADASVRLRCYNIIRELETKGVSIELYKPCRKYNIIFFMKCYSDQSVRIAQKEYKKGNPIVTEVFWEHFGNAERMHTEDNILEIVHKSKIVCACSEVQQELFSQYHDNVILLPESVERVEETYKVHEQKESVSLIWCGYSVKAKDLLSIKNVILKMIHDKNCNLIIVSEKDPLLHEIPYKYIKYVQSDISSIIKEGDIFIAPRPLEGIGKRSNSLTRIALPMSIGLPVVASPVPSYQTSPAILCRDENEWEVALGKLIDHVEERSLYKEKGLRFIEENLSMEVIGNKYMEIINTYKRER